MFFTRLRALALVALGASLVAAAPVQSRNGFIGRPLAEVLKSGLFTTFKLSVVRRRPSREGRPQVSLFQPEGALRDHVRVVVRSTDEGTVAMVDATVQRSSLDGTTGAAARDFVRTLLRDGLRRGEEPAIDTLVKELESAAPPAASRGYEVVAGRQADLTITGKRATVALTNMGTGDSRLLRIAIHIVGFIED